MITIHISRSGGILTFHSRPDHQRESFQTLHSEGNKHITQIISHRTSISHLSFCTCPFYNALIPFDNPIQKKAYAFKEIIIIQIFNPKSDNCLPFLAILKVFKVSYRSRLVLLPLHWSVWKCKHTAQLLTCSTIPTGAPSWCGQHFQASHKIQAFFLLKQSWAVVASVPCDCTGDRVPQETAVISLTKRDSQLFSRRKPWASTCWGWICGFSPSCGRQLAPEKHVPTFDPTV